jgi:hypothetical protein
VCKLQNDKKTNSIQITFDKFFTKK